MLQPIDIGHPEYLGLASPDTAFWSLIRREKLGEALVEGSFLEAYRQKEGEFVAEMARLRGGLVPSAVYFNPTERCNLNCGYCYIPEDMRRSGKHMTRDEVLGALERLKAYFKTTVPEGRKPQVIFHGSEPLVNRDAVFAGIEAFQDDFLFGVQTNATLLDTAAADFLRSHEVGIGLSLDAAIPEIADTTRHTWDGHSVFGRVLEAIDLLAGYPNYNVICTITQTNMAHLSGIVDFFHEREVPACMLNIVRCTLPGARELKPGDLVVARHFMAALDRTYELYQKTGRKLVVANFANILLAIMAPSARRLMCDISPCGGGRCFFALAANGDLFPCSEFIGLPEFSGGNLFQDGIEVAMRSEAFARVTGRKIEAIDPCGHCAIRHFCGSPCPAEAANWRGGMQEIGAFCEFYEEQVRYALRLIADGRQDAFLWDGWADDSKAVFQLTAL